MLRSQLLGEVPYYVWSTLSWVFVFGGNYYLPVLLPLMQAYRGCTYSEGLSWRLMMCWHYSIHKVLLYSSWGLYSSPSSLVKHQAGLVSMSSPVDLFANIRGGQCWRQRKQPHCKVVTPLVVPRSQTENRMRSGHESKWGAWPNADSAYQSQARQSGRVAMPASFRTCCCSMQPPLKKKKKHCITIDFWRGCRCIYFLGRSLAKPNRSDRVWLLQTIHLHWQAGSGSQLIQRKMALHSGYFHDVLRKWQSCNSRLSTEQLIYPIFVTSVP